MTERKGGEPWADQNDPYQEHRQGLAARLAFVSDRGRKETDTVLAAKLERLPGFESELPLAAAYGYLDGKMRDLAAELNPSESPNEADLEAIEKDIKTIEDFYHRSALPGTYSMLRQDLQKLVKDSKGQAFDEDSNEQEFDLGHLGQMAMLHKEHPEFQEAYEILDNIEKTVSALDQKSPNDIEQEAQRFYDLAGKIPMLFMSAGEEFESEDIAYATYIVDLLGRVVDLLGTAAVLRRIFTRR